MKKFYKLWPRFLIPQFTELRPGAECMNIISYVMTFPVTTARKTFFGTPTGPTQTSLFRYVNSRSMFKLEQKKNIIHFDLKITMFYSREKMNYWPGSINLILQVF